MADIVTVNAVPRLIVFDLDGTLIDSRADLADSANALIVERGGCPLPEEAIARMVGEGAAVLVRRALSAAGLPAEDGSVARFLELYDQRLLVRTRPYDGIPEVLKRLSARDIVAVLTNKPLAPSRKLLDGLGLSLYVSTVIGGDGPFPRKPEPHSLLGLIAHHHGSRARTILIGDSRIDLLTARAAGTAICLARYGFGFESVPVEDLLAEEGVVDRPAEIPGEIDRLLEIRVSES